MSKAFRRSQLKSALPRDQQRLRCRQCLHYLAYGEFTKSQIAQLNHPRLERLGGPICTSCAKFSTCVVCGVKKFKSEFNASQWKNRTMTKKYRFIPTCSQCLGSGAKQEHLCGTCNQVKPKHEFHYQAWRKRARYRVLTCNDCLDTSLSQQTTDDDDEHE